MKLPSTLGVILEKLLNTYLQQDPESAAALTALEGRRIAISLDGLGVEFSLILGSQGIRVDSTLPPDAEAKIHAHPLALLRMSLSKNPTDAFRDGDVRIEGDNELGERLWKILTAVEFDWEELMSHYLGDPLAHTLGSQARAVNTLIRRNISHLIDDAGEYVTEESQLSPTQPEVEDFLSSVDRLREDFDRLEARLARIESAVTPDSSKKSP